APLAVSGSALTFFRDDNNWPHWAYFGTDQHLYLIDLNSTGYHYVDILSWAGAAPVAASGSPLASYFQATNYTQIWGYLGTNQHVYQLYGSAISGPSYTDVTLAAGAPAAVTGSDLTFFMDSYNTPHWVYVGANQHAYLIYQDTSAVYHYVDLTVWAGNS